ncbi:helix-turn-helix transcriptional regulator [Listeria ilorinensis]|uniref:helix-turn-helix transcriptional regulator n=1 Tax=Listeria ilorinensis TaxID=2867439 RepID=UPI001EF4C496|nr:helix-turn-helix transcriptional regulator [Listeria ilorinensis]
MTIGKNIKRYREKLGLTQSALSISSGVPQTTISGLENKDIIPSLVIAKKLADALGVTTDDLLSDKQSIS